jgi:putative ABC transport system permease protein
MSALPRAGRSGSGGGWRTLVGTGTTASAALAVLVFVTVFVAMSLPRASLILRTNALQQVFAKLPSGARTMTANVDFADFAASVGGAYLPANLATARGQLAAQMESAKVPIEPGAAWSSLSTAELSVSAGAPPRAFYGGVVPRFEGVYRDALRRYARLQAGTWPASVTRHGGTTTFQIAVTSATASFFQLRAGSRLGLGSGLDLEVSGIVRPEDPGAAFWTEFPGLLSPDFTSTSSSGYWTGQGFVGGNELAGLVAATSGDNAQVAWVYPMNLGSVNADGAGALVQHIGAAAGQATTMFSGPSVIGPGLSLGSGVTQALAAYVASEQQVTGILSLLFVSLAVLGVVVLLLSTQLVADRRADEFAVMRARGATRWQLGWLTLRGGVLTALPAAVLAIGLAIAITSGGGSAQAWWLAAATGLTGLLAPALLAARRDPTTRRSRRGAVSARRIASARRLVLELAVTAMAIAGLIVLRAQGLSATGSINPLASAGPVLAAVPAAIIMVRLSPLVLGRLLRLAGRGSGVITFVGLARGTQRAAAALLPVFALVLTLAIVAFGGTVRAAVARGEQAASWQLSGADAVVGSPATTIALPLPARQAMAAVHGVQRVATVLELTGSTGSAVGAGTQINVAVIDPGQYNAVLARTPAPLFPPADLARPPAGSPIPIVASPSAAALLRGSGDVATINGSAVHVAVRAELSSSPAAPAGQPFMLVPTWAAAGNLPPTMLLLSGPRIDQAALSAVVARMTPGTTVTFQAAVLADLASNPLPRATYLAYAEGSAAAALFSVLVVLISLLLGARTRELVDARLSTMGLSEWQSRRVGIVETIPLIVAAAIGGVLAVIILVPLISPQLDLSVFTGTTASVQVTPDVPTLALAFAGLVLLAIGTLIAQAVAAHRRGIARLIRIGE